MKKRDRQHLWMRPLAIGGAMLLVLAGFAVAQEAPAPRKSPRIPVNREPVAGREALPQSRDLQGAALIIDSERLQVGGADLRLFGVVPPQLSASFGPQARAALDNLTKGRTVDCHIRDRSRDGRFLATCRTQGGNNDLALELLRRGLAVTARGSIQSTELADSYAAAEQAAQAQKLGLWAAALPPAASLTAVPPVAAAENANVPPLPPTPPAELRKEERPAGKAAAPAPEKESAAVPDQTADTTPAADIADQVATALPEDEMLPLDAQNLAPSGEAGFFARYQLLIAGLVMLATASGILAVIALQRRQDRRDEIKALAAALRGELLAARAVCHARLKTWTGEDEKNAAWPRIRAALYQAYVGRLGWLGANLARQIASIYGQASDYAAYYSSSAGEQTETPSRKQALETLVRHIEEVLPRLASVERTGTLPVESRTVDHAVLSQSAAEPAAEPSAEAPSAAVASSAIASTLSAWSAMKNFARAHLAPPETQAPPAPDMMQDYTALIEEEAAGMPFGAEKEPDKLPENVTKIRSAGS